MKIIVGLGNPGKKFFNSRHNFGAEFVGFVAKENDVELKPNKKLLCELGQFELHDEKILLVIPTTYMNLSGECVRAIKSFYKVGIEDIVVVHDEMDLPFGVVRIKTGGGAAGHHGVESVANAVSDRFWRFRMGINSEHIHDTKDYVLGKFEKEEATELKRIFKLSWDYLKKSLREGLSNTTLK